ANVGAPDVAGHRGALCYLANHKVPTCAPLNEVIDDVTIFGERHDRGRRGTLREDGAQDGALPGKTWHRDDDQRTFTAPNVAQRLGDVRRHRPIGDKVVEA